jgi:hypothetical protein
MCCFFKCFSPHFLKSGQWRQDRCGSEESHYRIDAAEHVLRVTHDQTSKDYLEFILKQ